MKYKHEMIMGYRGLPFKVSTYQVEKTRTHWHDNLELLLVLNGSVEIRINDQVHMLEEEEILMINSQEIHSTRRTKKDNTLLLLQIDVKYYSTYYPEFRNMVFERDYFKKEENKNDSDILKKHMAKIVWGLNKKKIGYRFSVGSEVALLLSHVMRNSKKVKIKEFTHVDKNSQLLKIQEILDYINENFTKGVTLNDISDKVFFSTGHLSRFFKDMMGVSFQEYLDYVRVDKASDLLLSTDKLITQVAHESGLASTKTLNRLFRDHFDCTPSRFRSEYGEIIQHVEKKIEKNNKGNKSYLDINRTDSFKNLFKYLDFTNFDECIDLETDLNFNEKKISSNLSKKGKPFTDYWRNLATFGRASEGLRSDVQAQLRELQNNIGFRYIRFHGIFSDEMMIYNVNDSGQVEYNWNYVNKLFDFFKEVNIKPFIELGFMPKELKSSEETMFWWDANVSQPKDINLWTSLVTEFVKHCINRYGLDEVKSWYFEIWNQPEIEQIYWIGSKEDYFNFYKDTVIAIKSISKDLKVGGPSVTNQAICGSEWIDEFLIYCTENNVPLDYISAHIYPEKFTIGENSDDLQTLISALKSKNKESDVMGIEDDMKLIYLDKNNTPNTLDVLNDKVNKYIKKATEVHITEWNASSKNGNLIHDTCYVANFIIDNVLKCAGKTESLGYWTFTDIMEEVKCSKNEFHGGFGILTSNDLKKPSYFAYSMLSKLGNKVIEQGDEYIVTRRNDDIQILTYNYVYFDELFLKGEISTLLDKQRYTVFEEKSTNKVEIDIKGIEGYYKITKYKLDRENGSVYDDWVRMGSPENMNKEELEYLKGKSHPETIINYVELDGKYKDEIYTKPHGISLIILEKNLR